MRSINTPSRPITLHDLATWGPKLLAEMMHLPGFQDVSSDQQNGGLDELLHYDRVTAAKLGQTAQSLDASLYGAFGQSEVSLIYTQLNQYYVILEVAPEYWAEPGRFEDRLLPSSRHQQPNSQRKRPAFGDGVMEDQHHSACVEPHGPLPFRHGFVQPRARRLAQRCDA